MCVHEAEYSAVLPVDEEKTTWDSPEGTKPQACSPLWASRQTLSPLPDFQRPKTTHDYSVVHLSCYNELYDTEGREA